MVAAIRRGGFRVHPRSGVQKRNDMQDFGGAKLILFVGARIVVIERDDNPGIPWPGYLDLPGGGREGAETAQACVLREAREEVGLVVSPGELVWQSRYKRGVFFAAHLPERAEDKIVFGKEGLGWSLMVPRDYIAHPKAIPHFALMVTRYLAQGG